ncbi:hypothetical protein D9V32_02355 [Mycetocola tolaasinivorans]|uniref:Uncharacterized protein n=1 Tax=Mycetocola tolaasinivorans TaxID=76635 RepID=A0A3L7AAI0_9MICO|nr:hypothetical protein D9V32_02355 [Mycetocola tolaasinivorans]
MRKLATILVGAALSATTLVGIQISQPAPAEAASCRISNLGWWSVKNDTCRTVMHRSITTTGSNMLPGLEEDTFPANLCAGRTPRATEHGCGLRWYRGLARQ